MKQLLCFTLSLFMLASLAYSGSLKGVVRDAQTLLPIDTVNVTVHVVKPDSVAFPTKTDQNGAYSITGINPNNEIYVVVTHRIGYIYSYTRIDNLGSLDLVYDIYLTVDTTTIPPSSDDTSTVFGTIMSPQNGSFKAIANVQVDLNSGNQHFNATTNSEGKYSANIPLGLYSVNINASGYENLSLKGIHIESTSATINAILKSTGTGVNTGAGQSRPDRFTLSDAYPNPFNPNATIRFSLPERGWATLKVYDNLGREVALLANGEFAGGVEHQVTFNASNLTSGVYFSRLEFLNQSVVKKLMLLK